MIIEERPLTESAETLSESRGRGKTIAGIGHHRRPIGADQPQRTHEIVVGRIVGFGGRRRRNPILLIIVHGNDRVNDALERLLTQRALGFDFGPLQNAVVAKLVKARVGERLVLDLFQANDAVGLGRGWTLLRSLSGGVIFVTRGGF